MYSSILSLTKHVGCWLLSVAHSPSASAKAPSGSGSWHIADSQAPADPLRLHTCAGRRLETWIGWIRMYDVQVPMDLWDRFLDIVLDGIFSDIKVGRLMIKIYV